HPRCLFRVPYTTLFRSRAGARQHAAIVGYGERLLRRVRRSCVRAGRAGNAAERAAGADAGPERGRRGAVAAAPGDGGVPAAGASTRGPRHRVLIPAFAGSNPAAPAKTTSR